MYAIFVFLWISVIAPSLGCICWRENLQEAYENVTFIAKIKVTGYKDKEVDDDSFGNVSTISSIKTRGTESGDFGYNITYYDPKEFIANFNIEHSPRPQPSRIISCPSVVHIGEEYLMGINIIGSSVGHRRCGHIIRYSQGSKMKVEAFQWSNNPKSLLGNLLWSVP